MRRKPVFIVLACLSLSSLYAQSDPVLILSPNSTDSTDFGTSTALFGTRGRAGRSIVAIGAPSANGTLGTPERSGRVYMYSDDPATFGPTDSLQLPVPEPGDLFGFSLGTEYPDSHSDLLAVGAPGANAALVFDGMRHRQFHLVPPTGVNGEFGYAIDVNHGFMVVGAPGIAGGAVFIWTSNFYDEEGPLRLDPPNPTDQAFGSALSITSWVKDSTRMAVSARDGEGAGSVYIFHFDGDGDLGRGTWVQEALLTGARGFGKSVDMVLHGRGLVVATDDSLHFFARRQAEWSLTQSLGAPDDEEWSTRKVAWYGFSLATPELDGQWSLIWTGETSEAVATSPVSACSRCLKIESPGVQTKHLSLPEESTRAFGASVAWNPYVFRGALIGDPLVRGRGGVYAFHDAIIVSNELQPEPATVENIEIWPNPANRQLSVLYDVEAAEPVLIMLVDLLGRTLKSAVPSPSLDSNRRVTIDISDLPSGAYVMVLQTKLRSISRLVTILGQ